MLLTTISIIVDPFVNQPAVTNYSVHIMLGMLFLSLIFLFFRKVQLAFLGLLCTGLIAIFLKTASNTNLMLPKQNKEAKIRVAHYNLGNIDGDFPSLYERILQDSADIISFQEYTPDWSVRVKNGLKEEFPFYKEVVRIDPYGVALFSRKAFAKADTFMNESYPSLEMTLYKEEKPFQIISSYVTPSLDDRSRKSAVNQLNNIAYKIQKREVPVIAIGEYNMVYWSQELRRFVDMAGLINSRRSIADGNLRIPFDHIFFSKELQCIEFKEVQDMRNNHIGIVGTYQMSGVNANKPVRKGLSG